MQSPLRLTAALLFLGSTLLMLVSWAGLMSVFEYPQILRQEPAQVLTLFLAGGDGLRLLWTGMTASSVLLIVCILLLHRLLSGPNTGFLMVGTVFGVLSGVVQVVGLVRWVLVVPVIASHWQNDPAQRPVWEALFTVVNEYGGAAIGETLGYLFTAVWIAVAGVAILKTKVLPRFTGWLSVAVGAGIAAGILEHTGQGWAAAVNASAYLGLLALLVVFGVRLLRSKKTTGAATSVGARPGGPSRRASSVPG